MSVNRISTCSCLSPPLTCVTYLSSAGLGEFRIRDLNDEINKLLREKGHWEVRIKELGGPDYAVSKDKSVDEGKPVACQSDPWTLIIDRCVVDVFVSQRVGPKMLDHEGKEVPGNRGYKYFGAARDLPGVRELFEKERT